MSLQSGPTLLTGVPMASLLWGAMWRFPQNLEVELPCEPATRRAHSEPMGVVKRRSHRHTHSLSLTVTKRQKQLRCPQMNRTWHTQTTQYHSAFKRKGILSHAMARLSLEGCVLSKIRQPREDTQHPSPHAQEQKV